MCEFLGFLSSTVEVSIFLGYGDMSLGNWHPMFQDRRTET